MPSIALGGAIIAAITIFLLYAMLGINGLIGSAVTALFLHIGYRLKHGVWWD